MLDFVWLILLMFRTTLLICLKLQILPSSSKFNLLYLYRIRQLPKGPNSKRIFSKMTSTTRRKKRTKKNQRRTSQYFRWTACSCLRRRSLVRRRRDGSPCPSQSTTWHGSVKLKICNFCQMIRAWVCRRENVTVRRSTRFRSDYRSSWRPTANQNLTNSPEKLQPSLNRLYYSLY